MGSVLYPWGQSPPINRIRRTVAARKSTICDPNPPWHGTTEPRITAFRSKLTLMRAILKIFASVFLLWEEKQPFTPRGDFSERPIGEKAYVRNFNF